MSSAMPVYLQIAEELRSQIHASKWAPGEKLPPEPAFAKEFGTSRDTFRKALSILARQGIIQQHQGKGTFVSEMAGESAPKTHLSLVGAVGQVGRGAETTMSGPYWSRFVHGIQEGLSAHGNFDLVIASRPVGDLNFDIPPGVKGLFLFPTFVEAMRLAGHDLNAIPHVCLCTSIPDLRRHDNVFVDTDNVTGAVSAVDYLAGQGHRDIAHIHADLTYCNPRDRVQGFRAGAEKHGISPEHARIYPVSSREMETVSQEIRPILEGSNRPTAIFAGGFDLALGVMAAAKSLELRIPDDLSLVGFDDYETGPFMSPPLTTVRQPVREMGIRAAEMMLMQLSNKPLKSRQTVLQTELIVRESCQAARESDSGGQPCTLRPSEIPVD